jgi:predicted transcriptional regulator
MKKTASRPPAKKASSERVSFRLPSSLLRSVDELARANNTDRSAVLHIALTRIVKSGI